MSAPAMPLFLPASKSRRPCTRCSHSRPERYCISSFRSLDCRPGTRGILMVVGCLAGAVLIYLGRGNDHH
jgi:hypothetical protein